MTAVAEPAHHITDLARLWNQPNLAHTLTERDIAEVFRILQRHGWSQRAIGQRTSQSQSEISEILHGRKVTSYPVLDRIASGLAIPRGRLGLAYDPPNPDTRGPQRSG